MERRIEGKVEKGVFFPDEPQVSRNLAEAKLTEAYALSARHKVKKSRSLMLEAAKLELNAFEKSGGKSFYTKEEYKDYEMMGASIVSAIDIYMQIGSYLVAEKLGNKGLAVLGKNAPEFTDRIEDKIKKVQEKLTYTSTDNE